MTLKTQFFNYFFLSSIFCCMMEVNRLLFFTGCLFWFFCFASLICSCGSCGYPLNLISSNRITSGIDSEYRKSIKKGLISFISVDLSRFTQVDKVNCFPLSWGRHRSKTKLLCRKCGVHIGYAYGDSSALCGFDSPNSSSSAFKKFTVKIRALQPSEES